MVCHNHLRCLKAVSEARRGQNTASVECCVAHRACGFLSVGATKLPSHLTATAQLDLSHHPEFECYSLAGRLLHFFFSFISSSAVSAPSLRFLPNIVYALLNVEYDECAAVRRAMVVAVHSLCSVSTRKISRSSMSVMSKLLRGKAAIACVDIDDNDGDVGLSPTLH